jgi:uncharacterized protein (DUF58 family)
MPSVEQYLRPEVAHQIKRLDLRAQFVAKGFLQGLHASPYHGFSVEFSEHRRYVPGDDPKDIDWLVYAKTDKYYVKKFEAETNITGYVVVDISQSMGYTYRQELTKLDYSICLAAALSYLMIHQQDPVGLVLFAEKIYKSLEPRSKRSQLGNILAMLAQVKPSGQTNVGASLVQLSAMLRHRSLVMIFSDLLSDLEPVLTGLVRLRHRGHDVIVFHILDEAEVTFPFQGLVMLEDPESQDVVTVHADSYQRDYLKELTDFRRRLQEECARMRIDYVPLDTSMRFDRALMEYLMSRQARF